MSEEGPGRDGRGGILPDAIRRALVSGIGAVFMTEEGIRNMLSELRLPKDAMAYLVQQTERTRRELFRTLADEVKGVVGRADLTRELRRALHGMRVQVRAEVRFSDDGSSQTNVEADVVRRRRRPAASPAAASDAPGDGHGDAAPVTPRRRGRPARSGGRR